MAAAHGAGRDPMAVHVSPSAARSHELIQPSKDSSRQRRGRSRVWIREVKKYGVGGMDEVWNRKYEPGPIRGEDRFDHIDICAHSAP